MSYEQVKRTRRSFLTMEPHTTATIRTYEFGTEDRHGDPNENQTTNSPYSVPVWYDVGGGATREADPQGEELEYDMTAYLRDDAGPVTDGVLAGAAEDRPESEMDIDGQTFQVVRRLDDAHGMVRLNMVVA